MAKRKRRRFRRVWVQVSSPAYYVVDVEVLELDASESLESIKERTDRLACWAVQANHERMRPYYEERRQIASVGHYGSSVTNIELDAPGDRASRDHKVEVVPLHHFDVRDRTSQGKVYAFAAYILPEKPAPEVRTVIAGGNDADQG